MTAAPHPYRHRLTLSVREVTEIAAFSEATIYKLIDSGELEARKIHGRYHICAASLWTLLGLEDPEPEEDDFLRRFRSEIR